MQNPRFARIPLAISNRHTIYIYTIYIKPNDTKTKLSLQRKRHFEISAYLKTRKQENVTINTCLINRSARYSEIHYFMVNISPFRVGLLIN